jgi:broad specificity phosphatase PhoE
MRAALYVSGRVVTGDSHIACFEKLTESEQDQVTDSGFFDCESGQFISDREREVFDEKEMYMIRHGQSTCPDEPDPDITPDGICQVQQAVDCLATQDLREFIGFTSPLLRCLQTANILHNSLGIKFHIVPEIMETPHFLEPEEIFKVKNRSHMFPQFDWPTSQEWHVLHETPLDFFKRVKETLQQFPCHSILVTHYGFICLTAKLALCKAVLKEGFPPASVTYFHRHDGKRLGRTNEKIHEDRPSFADRKAG